MVLPAMLAIGDKLIGNPTLATFAAFGSFAMLGFVDFPGRLPERLQSELALGLAGGVLVCLGTLTSRSTALAVVAMALVGFCVLFAGVVSSVLAGATTALLLAFILPVSLPGPPSSIPDRLAGWGLAVAAALVAIAVLWPAPASVPVRDAAVRACRALAHRLRTRAALGLTSDVTRREELDAAIAEADRAIADLEMTFFATPYRPTGLSTSARAVIRLVDELRWLNEIVIEALPRREPGGADPHVCALEAACAELLERTAELLSDTRRPAAGLHDAQQALAAARDALESGAEVELPAVTDGSGRRETIEIVSGLDPGFRAQELSFGVSQIAMNVDFAAAAERRTWAERLMGRQPEGVGTTLAAAQERAGSFISRHSVWLQNSIRGAVGLGGAVLAAKLTGVGHAFWVVLGALAVLRSNALNTGQSVVRGILGTVVGFAVGAGVVLLVGTDTTVLWFILPPAVLLATLAPATISFAAGQAAFTLTLLILFNILQPEGWRIGLVRVADVALGGAVSLAVGLLFWPRGAGAALGKALAGAYLDSVAYLARAVEFGVRRCDGAMPAEEPPAVEGMEAAAASRRLDDAFRGYLAERGSKPLPLAEVTSLVNGVVGLRLAGDAILDLWDGGSSADGDRSAAQAELLAEAGMLQNWYGRFASSLIDGAAVPEPLAQDEMSGARLVDAVSHNLLNDDGKASATGVRIIWTGDHLDAARRMQSLLVGPARAAAAEHAL